MPTQTHSSKYNVLQKFLDKNRGTLGFTHTSIGAPMGKYDIKLSNLEEFYKLYHTTVFENKIPIYLTEGIKDCDLTPIKIDVDLRYYNKNCVRTYTDGDIDEICMLYMNKIEEYLEELDDEERVFYILEKPDAIFDVDKKGNKKTKKDMFRIKDGFHIMAPHIITNDYLQLKFRDFVYKNCSDLLDRHNFDNSYADVFDRAVIDRNNWQMYGSTKPGKPAYLVSRAIRVYKDRVETVEEIPDSKELIQLLSVRNKTEYSLVKTEVEAEVWDPENNQPKKKRKRNKKKGFKTKIGKRELKSIVKYIKCLSCKRAQSFPTWIEVGWCLHNIHNKDELLLREWINWSKKVPEYADTCDVECREKWDEMSDEGYGIGSLKLWAKEDNEEMYYKILDNDVESQCYSACSNGKGSSYDIAKILHLMFHNFHVCVSIKDHTWYYYNDKLHRWQRDDKGIMLKRKISTTLYKQFNRIKIKCSQRVEEEDDPTHSDWDKKAQNISKVMFRLKETSFKSNLMTESAELFYDKEKKFLDKLDEANNLIGFNNGVYDLKKDEFREGRPEDYISKSTNINYIPYDPDSDEVFEIYEFYKQIFVIKTVREYVLVRSSSFLSGSTKDESFDIYSGGGGNGKSKHMELMETVFGDYAVKLPIQLLTSKRSASNAASPELARTKGARLASMQEPDTETTINVGLMKELTGGDKIQARALYGEPFEFKPKFKMVLCCNDRPKLPEKDAGTWRRVRNTEFSSKFTYDISPEKGLEFKINEELAENFENWAEPFMSILINYHKKYKKDGLKVPCEILEYTASYRESRDVFKDFINDCIIFEEGSDQEVNINEIYNVYKEWCKAVTGDKPENRNKIRDHFNDKFGSYIAIGNGKTNGYKGLTLNYENSIVKQVNPLDKSIEELTLPGYVDALDEK